MGIGRSFPPRLHQHKNIKEMTNPPDTWEQDSNVLER